MSSLFSYTVHPHSEARSCHTHDFISLSTTLKAFTSYLTPILCPLSLGPATPASSLTPTALSPQNNLPAAHPLHSGSCARTFSLGGDFQDQPLRNSTSQDVLPFFRAVVTGPDSRQHACLCITSQGTQKGRPLTAGPPLFTVFSPRSEQMSRWLSNPQPKA